MIVPARAAADQRGSTITEGIPTAWYTDPRVAALEEQLLLGSAWFYLGDAGAVAAPGSYLAAWAGREPVVVTRDSAGTLRALSNVCRHRGAVIASGCGTAETLMCPYHGWSYRLDGTVESSARTPVPAGLRLPELTVEAVGPLLFATRAADPAPVSEQLAPLLSLVDTVAQVDLGDLRLRERRDHVVAANWKVTVENFIECYHCPLVHRDSLPGFGRSDYTVEIHGPLQTQRLDRERFAFGYLFPVTQVSVYGEHRALVARSLHPSAPGETRFRLDYWFPRDVPDEETGAFVAFFEGVLAEDVPMCESTQVGVSSSLFPQGYRHPERERGLVAFHGLLREALVPSLEGAGR